MDKVFLRYLDPAFRYVKSQNPALVRGDRPRVEQEEFEPQYDGDELVNGGDFPVKHVAICTGIRDGGDHLLLHASSADGTNALWPLRRFRDYAGYG